MQHANDDNASVVRAEVDAIGECRNDRSAKAKSFRKHHGVLRDSGECFVEHINEAVSEAW